MLENQSFYKSLRFVYYSCGVLGVSYQILMELA